MITIDEYLKNRNIEYFKDYNDKIKNNSINTVKCINKLLDFVQKSGINIDSCKCNSGWRPKAVNNALRGSDPNSPHITGEAIDISDPNKKIRVWVANNPHLVHESGFLAIEQFDKTPTWIHLQTRLPLSFQLGKVIWKCINNSDVGWSWENNYTKEKKIILDT